MAPPVRVQHPVAPPLFREICRATFPRNPATMCVNDDAERADVNEAEEIMRQREAQHALDEMDELDDDEPPPLCDGEPQLYLNAWQRQGLANVERLILDENTARLYNTFLSSVYNTARLNNATYVQNTGPYSTTAVQQCSTLELDQLEEVD